MPSEPLEIFDVAVVGAGIAGASVAAELATFLRVLLLEMEDQPGYHTTGRSAALFSKTYGPPAIRALSRASAPFLGHPPQGFSGIPLLSPRRVLTVGRADQAETVDAAFAELSSRSAIERIGTGEALALMPLLRAESAAAVILDSQAADIDVHALHHGYLRRFRAAGGSIETGCEVVSLEQDAGGWTIGTRKGGWRVGIVVNAAGAWADEVARMAGVEPVGLVPRRRTAMMIEAPSGNAPDRWPMVVDIDEQFYLKPDAGRLLVSPADETPSPPCDAQPEEIDIAICAARIEAAFDLTVGRIGNSWAGLRSFVADKCPVVGFDDVVGGFFWLAGQGGYGIQTAPAMARSAAALILGRALPADIADEGVDVSGLSPARMKKQENGTHDQ